MACSTGPNIDHQIMESFLYDIPSEWSIDCPLNENDHMEESEENKDDIMCYVDIPSEWSIDCSLNENDHMEESEENKDDIMWYVDSDNDDNPDEIVREHVASSSAETDEIIILLDIGSKWSKIGIMDRPETIKIRKTVETEERMYTYKNMFSTMPRNKLNQMVIILLDTLLDGFVTPVENTNYHILLPFNSNFDTSFKEECISVLLTKYPFKSARALDPFQCALSATGSPHGIVIDVGYYTTKIKAVHPTFVNGKSKHYHIGFNNVIMNFKRLMRELGRLDFETFRVATDQLQSAITRTCFVEPMNGLTSMAPNGVSYEFSVQKQSAFCKITPTIRRSVYNVLFEEMNIAKIVLDELLQYPELYHDLASNILVIGGTTQIPGFGHRFKEELLHHTMNDTKYTKLKQLKLGTLLCRFPANLTTVIGASIFGSLLQSTGVSQVQDDLDMIYGVLKEVEGLRTENKRLLTAKKEEKNELVSRYQEQVEQLQTDHRLETDKLSADNTTMARDVQFLTNEVREQKQQMDEMEAEMTELHQKEKESSKLTLSG
eukprot:205346_1